MNRINYAQGYYYRGLAFQHRHLKSFTDLCLLLDHSFDLPDTFKEALVDAEGIRVYRAEAQAVTVTLDQNGKRERVPVGPKCVLLVVEQDKIVFDEIKELGEMPVYWIFTQGRKRAKPLIREFLNRLPAPHPIFARANLELLKDLALLAKKDERYGQVANRAINISIESLALKVLVDGLLNMVRFDSFASKNILDSLAFHMVDKDVITLVKAMQLRYHGTDGSYLQLFLDSYGNLVIQPDEPHRLADNLRNFVDFLREQNLLSATEQTPLFDPDLAVRSRQRRGGLAR